MGGFNLNHAIHHASQQATNQVVNTVSTAASLANPLPSPAKGRSTTDQLRTITRKTGSTLKESGNIVGKAGDALAMTGKYGSYAGKGMEIGGMGLTMLGMPEVGIPLMESGVEVREDALEISLLGSSLQNASAWMEDTGSILRNVSKGAEKGVRDDHLTQLAVTSAGYEYRDNMHKPTPIVPNCTIDQQFVGDRRAVVYTHNNTGDVYLNYNGTDPKNLSDLAADAYIASGTESKSSRFKYAERVYNDVKNKYPDKSIHLMGHSLGGQEAAYVGCKNEVASVTTFNRGSNPFATDVDNKNCSSNVTNYKTRNDPISTGPFALPHQKLIVLQGSGGYDPHGMSNFTGI